MANRKPVATAILPTISNDPRESTATCPICRTTRYLNRDLLLQIDPECYHPMCTSCIASHFKDGPAQCPYEGCYKTLRTRNFRTPRFDDLNVEREVDIRKQVAAVFNKTEDDFEDLRAWNDYLNMVEDLTDTVVNGSEKQRAAAEGKMRQWEAQHKSEIAASRKRRGEADEMARQRMEEEDRLAAERRRQALLEDQQERAKEAQLREEVLSTLEHATSGHAEQTLNKILLKKRGLRPSAASAADSDYSGPGLSIRGLKRNRPAASEDYNAKPYDAFGGVRYVPDRYVPVETMGLDPYDAEWVDKLRTSEGYTVGGYDFGAYLERLLFEASGGLGVFVEEEKATVANGDAGNGTAASSAMEVDDVFS